MNIFWLDASPVNAAQAIYDIHLTKQILEIAQMVGTIAFDHYGDVWTNTIISTKHRNHPVTAWMREDGENIRLALRFATACGYEYTRRTGEINLSMKYIYGAQKAFENMEGDFPRSSGTLPPIVMEEHPECWNPTWEKDWLGVINAYRNLYAGPKFNLHDHRPRPSWFARHRELYISRSTDNTKLPLLPLNE